MFCTNCGTKLPEDASFCMNCGAKVLKPVAAPQETPVEAPAVPQPEPIPGPIPEPPAASQPEPLSGPNPEEAPAEPEIPVPVAEPQPIFQPQPDAGSPYPYQAKPMVYAPPAETPQPEFPMKWFKFVIYFQLFFGAFVNLCNMVLYLSGAIYGSDSGLVYAAFRGMRVLDILMGVICLALAAYSIFVRFQLAKFRRNAPALLYILLACNAGFNLFYGIGSTIIVGQNLISATTVGNLIGTIILLALNVVYFNKRKSLFIH